MTGNGNVSVGSEREGTSHLKNDGEIVNGDDARSDGAWSGGAQSSENESESESESDEIRILTYNYRSHPELHGHNSYTCA